VIVYITNVHCLLWLHEHATSVMLHTHTFAVFLLYWPSKNTKQE